MRFSCHPHSVLLLFHSFNITYLSPSTAKCSGSEPFCAAFCADSEKVLSSGQVSRKVPGRFEGGCRRFPQVPRPSGRVARRFGKVLEGPARCQKLPGVAERFLTGSGHSSGKVPGELLHHSALAVQNIREFSFFVLGYLYFGLRHELSTDQILVHSHSLASAMPSEPGTWA